MYLLSSLQQKSLLTLTGADLGLKNELFLDYLLADTAFGALAFALVLMCIYLYTNSLLFTLVALVSVLMSLGVAYFFYTVVFGQGFFPFANLLTMVLMIGLGADDAFVYRLAWKKVKIWVLKRIFGEFLLFFCLITNLRTYWLEFSKK